MMYCIRRFSRKILFQIVFLFSVLLLAACGEKNESTIQTAWTDQVYLQNCVSKPFLQGVDISEWQEDVDWQKIAGDGYTFAFIRVSYGASFVDRQFFKNWPEAKKAGLIRGAYQYFLPSQSVEDQVDLMIESIGTLEVGDLPPVLDVETTEGLNSIEMQNRVRNWVSLVRKKLGVNPIIYSGSYFWQDNVGGTEFTDLPLWLPQYTNVQKGVCADAPFPWTRWTFWQWTDSAKVSGAKGPIDANVFQGSLADLKKLTVQAKGQVFCPESFQYDRSSKLCVRGREALGPFTKRMINNCIVHGGGKNTCQGSLWEKSFAVALRGINQCMDGAVWDSRRQACVEGQNAYGPFTDNQVAACKRYSGGLACESMRIGVSFLD